MKIAIGADISGFELKEAVRKYLEKKEIDYVDFGTKSTDNPVDYFKIAPDVCRGIQRKQFTFGFLFCGTGMGMAQVANIFKGIRAAVCESVYAAKMSRAINDSNILAMGGFLIGPEMGIAMADIFLNTTLTQDMDGFHDFLLYAQDEIKKLEETLY
jgi:ribose 5-phosphate isomerase B